MYSMLSTRVVRLEALARRRRPRRVVVVYENDWRENSPASIESRLDPDVDIIRIRYVDDWPPAPETVAPKARKIHARVERGNVATAEDLRDLEGAGNCRRQFTEGIRRLLRESPRKGRAI